MASGSVAIKFKTELFESTHDPAVGKPDKRPTLHANYERIFGAVASFWQLRQQVLLGFKKFFGNIPGDLERLFNGSPLSDKPLYSIRSSQIATFWQPLYPHGDDFFHVVSPLPH